MSISCLYPLYPILHGFFLPWITKDVQKDVPLPASKFLISLILKRAIGGCCDSPSCHLWIVVLKFVLHHLPALSVSVSSPLKFNKDFVYKMVLLTMINLQGTYKMMFSVQFVAEFSRMKFYPLIQSKTLLVP